MKRSIQQISNGATFMVDFKKIVVERCHYINAIEERVEPTSILSNATATMLRVADNGTIFIQVFDADSGKEFPLAQFKVSSFFYRENDGIELAQTSMIRGNEITEELPITHTELECGKISLFSISKQKGKTIAFLILNPRNIDDYYYRIMFEA